MTQAIVWPDSLPFRPLRGSWQAGSPGGVIESGMQAGVVTQRVASTIAVHAMAFTLSMSLAEFIAFRDFYDRTLMFGAAAFRMHVWDGQDYVDRRVAFTGERYSARDAGVDRVHVSINLKVESL